MKNFIIFFMVMLASFATANEAKCSSDFYYYKGDKIKLSLDSTKYGVAKFNDNSGMKYSASRSGSDGSEYISSDERYTLVVYNSGYSTETVSAQRHVVLEKGIYLPCYVNSVGKTVMSTPYVYVKLKSENDKYILDQLMEGYGLEMTSKPQLTPLWYVLSLNADSYGTPVEIANHIYESGLVKACEPDFISDDHCFSYDPDIEKQYHCVDIYDFNTVSKTDISLCDAWNYTTGKGIKVAVIDSPIDRNHKDLKENISELGYDADRCGSPAEYYDTGGYPDYHGTHVTGVLASIRNNNFGGVGVAPDAEIVAISYFHKYSGNRYGRALGIKWAAHNGVDVINCSWGYDEPYEFMDDAIDEAYNEGRNGKGCIIVFSAGNESSSQVCYPGRTNNNVLVVGATNRNGDLKSDSNYGSRLDVVAPGEDIHTTDLLDCMNKASGTSLSAPIVAGIAALVLEINPDLTADEVMTLIKYNTKENYNKALSRKQRSYTRGYGMVDAYMTVRNTPKKK